MTHPAADARQRLRRVGFVLLHVLGCFVIAGILQPVWSRAAGAYTDALSAVSRQLVPHLEPAPVFGGFSRSGTVVEVASGLTGDRPLGDIETRHFSFYMPFVLLLLCVARWRLRLVSGPEILVILAFLFVIQACCLSLGALRHVVFALRPSGGFALIGPLEYNVLHTLYHTYCNFGPELWNGVVVGFVLLRGAMRSEFAPAPPATSRGLVAACAVLILPAVVYMMVAPVARRFTGEERRARMATARAYARAGNGEAATRLAREVLDSDGKDIWAMLLLGSLEEPVRPEQAAAWYEKALAVNPAQVSALVGLARVKASLGDGSAAEPLYYTALKIAPRNSEAYEGLGDIYMARHAYETARKPYEQAVRFGPDRPGLLLKLGNAHQLAGDPCAAREFYSRSLALDSSPEYQGLALGLEREVAALCARESR